MAVLKVRFNNVYDLTVQNGADAVGTTLYSGIFSQDDPYGSEASADGLFELGSSNNIFGTLTIGGTSHTGALVSIDTARDAFAFESATGNFLVVRNGVSTNYAGASYSGNSSPQTLTELNSYLSAQVAANAAPTVANAIADQSATEDSAFSFQFAANAFADADTGDSISYTATLSDGSALPSWLSFSAATRTFSGTPLNANVGAIAVKVIATDTYGATANDTFNITVSNTNDAPTVANTVADRNATAGNAFSFQFAANTFSDVDAGDTLTYTATLSSGSALPAWLSFDAATRTFSGTPSNADIGSISVKLIATDGSGSSTHDVFDIAVANANTAPTVANAIADQSASEDSAFSFQFAANTFSDADAGDSIAYTATLSDGTALPSWLSFNAGTRTFSGTPLNANVGTLAVKVIATDSAGATAHDVFNITVGNTNDAPTVANAIADQSATESSAFSFQFAANTFSDVDAGDTLTYTATLSNGNPLPNWLSFNSATRTFSGTPNSGGTLSIKVTGSDGSLSVNDFFDIAIAAAPAPAEPDPPAPTRLNADLNKNSDTGKSNNDRITSDTKPNFDINAGNLLAPGQTARLIDPAGKQVSSAPVTLADIGTGKITIPTKSILDDGTYTYTAQIVDGNGRVVGESPVTIQIVTDRDGVMPSVELAANGGDYNKDGKPDKDQANVTQLPLTSMANFNKGKDAPAASFGAVMAGKPDLAAPAGVRLNETAQLVDVKLVDAPSVALPGKTLATSPMFAFTLQAQDGLQLTDSDTAREGLQVQTIISLPQGVKADAFMKFNSATQSWYNYANPSAINGSADGAALRDTNGDGLIDQIVITITDGGVGDEDGLVNGAVVDPGLLADTGMTPLLASMRDFDGVAPDVESAAANKDFDLDGTPDWDQPGLAQLPMRSLDAYLLGKDAPLSTFGAIMVGKVDASAPIGARADAKGQLQGIQLLGVDAPLPAKHQAASPLLQVQVAAAADAMAMTDVDPDREGLQTQVIEYFATGIKANAYMVYDPNSQSWFNYTDANAVSGEVDGAALLDLDNDGLTDAVVVTLTDNGIGDDDLTVNGVISLHGMLVWQDF